MCGMLRYSVITLGTTLSKWVNHLTEFSMVSLAFLETESFCNAETLAYKLGEALSAITDHYLLMTATPHKGVVFFTMAICAESRGIFYGVFTTRR
jgi:hypothetical protein